MIAMLETKIAVMKLVIISKIQKIHQFQKRKYLITQQNIIAKKNQIKRNQIQIKTKMSNLKILIFLKV